MSVCVCVCCYCLNGAVQTVPADTVGGTAAPVVGSGLGAVGNGGAGGGGKREVVPTAPNGLGLIPTTMGLGGKGRSTVAIGIAGGGGRLAVKPGGNRGGIWKKGGKVKPGMAD